MPASQGRVGYALLGIAVLLGLGTQLASTRRGVGLVSDSATYIEGGRTLTHHPTAVFSLGTYGSVGHYANWPPLYSAALALPGLAGADVLTGARWVNAVCLVGLLLAFFTLLARRTSDVVAGLACLALVALGEFVQRDFAWALSEPLFLPLFTIALLLLDRSWDAIGWTRACQLVGCGVALGLASLTRFMGMGVVAAVVLVLLLQSEPGRRMRSATLVGTLGLLPVVVWKVTGGSSGTSAWRMSFYRVPWSDVTRTGESVGGWFLPERLADPLKVVTLLVTVGLLIGATWCGVGAARRSVVDPDVRLAGSLALAGVGASLMVVVGRLFLDAHVQFERRQLAPFAIALIGVAAILLARGWTNGRRLARPAAALIAAAIVLGSIPRTIQTTHIAMTEGLGYQTPAWQASPTLAYVGRLDRSRIVYTNVASVVYLQFGWAVKSIPSAEDGSYPSRLRAMRADIATHGGLVVQFDSVQHAGTPTAEAALPSGVVVERFADGVVVGPGG